MYLSRLSLNIHDRLVRRNLGNCQDLHRTLLWVWPRLEGPAGPRAQCGLLYRLEDGPRGAAILLVQSRDEPDWNLLPQGYLLDHTTKRVDAAYDAVAAGMRLRFRLRANPTRRISRERAAAGERLAGKRVDLRREDEQVAWLQRKGLEQCGFRLTAVQARDDVPNVRVQPEERALGRRSGSPLTFGSVIFEGELEVADAIAFRKAIEDGIGSGKAYGFGLLSIAPRSG